MSGRDEVAVYLQDAARTPDGHTPRVLLPASEAEIAWVLREAAAVLPIGAQSSLTGGATPFGEWVLSTARLTAIGPVEGRCVTAQAGVALASLASSLKPSGLNYPPVPTFTGAFVGGVASTNAAGAATFKYGSTRDWVQSLTVVLACGDVLDIERGRTRASADGIFEVVLTSGEARQVPIPRYAMPSVAKRSAGYHAEPGMDLVDLFVGSEGTLGVIASVALRLAPARPRLAGFLTFAAERQALDLVRLLRDASQATWAAGDSRGIDVAAIESLDRRCLELLREDGVDRANGLVLRADAEAAILFEVELSAGTTAGEAMAELAAADAADGPLVRLTRLLEQHGGVEDLVVALPGDTRRRTQLEAVREAVPLAVNHRIEVAQRTLDPQVHKVAADMVVPMERLAEAMALYREGFARRGLDHALWGHVSDGNIHANALPKTREDVRQGEEAILEFGRQVIGMGGCPMSEHGVGRNPVKQTLLRLLYGDRGIDEMRRVKRALDPEQKLAPDVVFPRSPS